MWYNAKIEKILADGACEVLFQDYGNTDKVRPEHIVVAATDIPEGDEIDECVDPGPAEVPPEKKMVEVGQFLIARWSEDNVWYRAKVLEVGQGSLQVLFTDYGNEEKVDEKNIVLCGADIPAEEEDFVDENVEGFKGSAEAEEKEKVPKAKEEKTVQKEEDKGMKHEEAKKPSQEDESKESSGEIPQAPKKETAPPPPQVGDSVVAKWSAVDEDGVDGDDVWYKARIEGVSDQGYRVLFVDYGNFCLVGKQKIVKLPEDIPKGDLIDDLVEIPVKEVKKGKEIATAEPDKTTTVGGELSVDTECLAKWTEDDVWYNAKIEKVLENGTYQVLFLDHGNSDVAPRSNIVLHFEEIPDEEEVDEYVIEPSTNTPSKDVEISKNPLAETSGDSKISPELPREISESSQKPEKIALVAEQTCLAKWDDDNVWYRAKVTKTSEATVEVVFIDYGNSAILARERIVLSYQDIPAEDVAQEMVDENVEAPSSEEILARPIAPSPSPQEEVKAVVSESPVEEKSDQCQWSVHDKCVARWGEDQCWYRGVIIALGQDKTSASVRFVDYDNEDKVNLQDIVVSSSQIPPGQEDFIDENVGVEPAVSAAEVMVLKKEEKETRSEPSPSLPGTLNTTTDSGIGKSFTDPKVFNFIEKNGLSIKKKQVFKVSTPAGVSVLADGSVAIVSRMSDCVKFFSRTGAPLPCLLTGHRKFDKPTNVLRLSNGKIVVRDTK